MSNDIREVKNITDLIGYFSENLGWNVDINDFDDIDDISYDFSAEDIGLKEESFAKISELKQLQPLVDGQKWGIFCVEFDSNRFEPSALKKILSGLIPRKRNSADHAVWSQQDLLFICNWGKDNNSTIGLAHFEDREKGLPQIKIFSCAPALEDFTQIRIFEERISKLAWPENTNNIEEWRALWSSAFSVGYKQTIQDSSTLTIQLAAEAQNIRDRILDTLKVETKNGYVHLLYEKFKDTLIHDMAEQQFADMYAQTIVYGLFSARCMDRTQDDFSTEEAIELIPNTNPFLKRLMKECIGKKNDNNLTFDELEIGNVVDLLQNTKTDFIIKDFNRQTGGGKEDTVIHFYEEFLTAYDKKQKVQRGVFYTPQSVVNFMVKSVDFLLKDIFHHEDGLASDDKKNIKIQRESHKKIDGFYKKVEDTIAVPAVQILDPATGTGTFLRQVILQIYSDFKERAMFSSNNEKQRAWSNYVDESLLKRISGFELMMAPYAVAHMKLAMVLKDTGYTFDGDNRLKVFLTNTLDEAGRSDGQMTLWDDPLATESIEANEEKMNCGISVVIGNPPYSNSSVNQNPWISNLLDTYKEGLNEKKINLDEDSIKFIRYGQYIIDRSGKGILAYISNNSFLTGVTHRKMRRELMNEFDQIFIINLHGDSNRLEKAPDGSKDENIFEIKQGVSINIFVKTGERKKTEYKIKFLNLYGTQEKKYSFLQKHTIEDIEWKDVTPLEPYYFFDDNDYSSSANYEKGFSIADLFLEKNTGVQTKNDVVTLKNSEAEVNSLIRDFKNLEEGEIERKYNIKHGGTWTVKAAKQDIIRNCYIITPILFRPFDIKYTALTDKSGGFLGRPRYSTMINMVEGFKNYALLVGRQNKSDEVDSFLITDLISEMKCAERTIQSYHFPLYVGSMDIMKNKYVPRANFNEKIVKVFEEKLSSCFDWNKYEAANGFSALDVLDYIYAILYIPKYRGKYKVQLKIDFAKIPYPKNEEMFDCYKQYGARLREIHTMKDENVDISSVIYEPGKNNLVENPKYSNGKVQINKSGMAIKNIPCEIWAMGVGGYVPLQKWLKDRKGTEIDEKDINHFRKMVIWLEQTLEIMKRLDEITDEKNI